MEMISYNVTSICIAPLLCFCFLEGIHLDLGIIFTELGDFLSDVAEYLHEVMDVGSFDQSILHSLQVLKFTPQIGATGLGTGGSGAKQRQDHIISGFLIQSCQGIDAVSPSPAPAWVSAAWVPSPVTACTPCERQMQRADLLRRGRKNRGKA